MFPVLLLLLNGTSLGVLERYFDEQPIEIPVTSDESGVMAAASAILVALGMQRSADVAGATAATQPTLSEPTSAMNQEETHLVGGAKTQDETHRVDASTEDTRAIVAANQPSAGGSVALQSEVLQRTLSETASVRLGHRATAADRS